MKRPPNRWAAFLIHLSISLIIFVILTAIIIFWWYPGALFTSAGGWQGIKIVAGVDLVVGPVLTLITYNFSKPLKELATDLLIIAFIQLSCLVAGIFIVYNERPAAVIFVHDTLYTAKIIDLEESGTSSIAKIFEPVYFYIEMPSLAEEASAVVTTHMIMGEPIHLRKDLLKTLPNQISALKEILSTPLSRAHKNQNWGKCINMKIITHYNEGDICLINSNDGFKLSSFISNENQLN